ncbi:MAG TPA: YihY/virulence factor BrkB family protein [Candidatus Sulfotelmatobacter sp.]|jgi:membrane protein|nr:YihY/virulence factor BrkB family protein [Candidatus Sulfotelmatobacter sp.]
MTGNIFLAFRNKIASTFVMVANTRDALIRTYHGVLTNQICQAAASLSYYSILCIFPALILLSAVMSYIPLPDFFQDALVAMGRVAPPGTMPMVDAVLKDILGANSGAWLSLGTLGTLWVVSSAFDEMIEALDAAYDVNDKRPFWKTRILALGLGAVTGLFLMCAIATLIVGPAVGNWLSGRLHLTGAFLVLWPFIHWIIAVSFTVFAVETVYFLAPNVKQRFIAALPGAIFSVVCWIGLSYLLRIYFRYFGNYNRTYGTLAGVMALMTWLYWAYFILLAGGELNAELAKARNISTASTAAEHRR